MSEHNSILSGTSDGSTRRIVTRSVTKQILSPHEEKDAIRRTNSEVIKVRKKTSRAVKTSRRPQRPLIHKSQSRHPFPSIRANTFPLIQESIAHNLYHIVIQAILWNQTSGKQARPILYALIEQYPTPKSLSEASLAKLTALLQPLGLHNTRARRCIALGSKWMENPPTPLQRHRRRGYPVSPAATGIEYDWEIAHLPGLGPYALDSFRIFHRDEMRGLAKDWLGRGASIAAFEPEWKRVLPLDKELRAYLKWLWLKEGYLWNELDGSKMVASSEQLAIAERSPENR
ncbi:hypothetical protein MMC19_006560 [Ptychographa xylographoides]|nr:hypothetical protein [Ptychographa xylographoides]